MKINNILNNKYIRNIIIIFLQLFSFLIIDIYLRKFSNNYIFVYRYTHLSPLLFSFSWSILFIGIYNLFKSKLRNYLYFITLIIFNLIILSQTLYMKILNNFYGLSDFFMAGEGSNYFKYALTLIDIKTVFIISISLFTAYISIKISKKTEDIIKDKYDFIIVVLLTIILVSFSRVYALKRLGSSKIKETWETAYNVRLIYDEYNNQGKNVEVSGIYEQTFRNSYLYIKEVLFNNKKEINKITDKMLKEKNNLYKENNYTNTFKDKNIIVILMESIDSFLIDEDIMPTLTSIKDTGWNFTNRYSPNYGGGQTINSEFSVNTGLYALNNSKSIYNFKNTYKYSLANMFKNNNYIANSIHENTAKFYNRKEFHKYLGFDNHYALKDMKNIKQLNYELDTNIIKNKELDKYIIYDNKFLTFITTYSAHMPYNKKENKNCKNLYNLDVDDNEELSCLRNLAHDTDEFLRLLIKKLDDNNKLDDTVLVLFTDHYIYGFEDKEYIYNKKDTNDINMLQHVPFIIWNNNIKHKNIDTLMDTADILPTILNLFGIKYDTRYYLGEDVFSEDRENFIYFNNNTFYDGELYYNNKIKIDKDKQDYVNDILDKINYNLELNKNFILGDYFKNK